MSDVSVADKWGRIDALRAKEGYACNDEGFTVNQYAEQFKLKREAARSQLGQMVSAGKLLKGYKYESDPSNRSRRVACFRLPQGGSQ